MAPGERPDNVSCEGEERKARRQEQKVVDDRAYQRSIRLHSKAQDMRENPDMYKGLVRHCGDVTVAMSLEQCHCSNTTTVVMSL